MVIQSETLFQLIISAIIGVLTWLGSLAVRNNRERFEDVNKHTKELSTRVDKLEDRLNNKLPETLQKLQTQINKVEGDIDNVKTKVDLISSNVIERVDRLENNLPSLIESTFYKLLASGALTISHDQQHKGSIEL